MPTETQGSLNLIFDTYSTPSDAQEVHFLQVLGGPFVEYHSPEGFITGRIQGLQNLKAGQRLFGFISQAVYINDASKPMGGSFIREAAGFTLDLLQIESVPQNFIRGKS